MYGYTSSDELHLPGDLLFKDDPMITRSLVDAIDPSRKYVYYVRFPSSDEPDDDPFLYLNENAEVLVVRECSEEVSRLNGSYDTWYGTIRFEDGKIHAQDGIPAIVDHEHHKRYYFDRGTLMRTEDMHGMML